MTGDSFKYMEYDVKFHALITKRKEKGISQRQMADELGVTESTISRWEKFTRRSLVAYFGYKRVLGG